MAGSLEPDRRPEKTIPGIVFVVDPSVVSMPEMKTLIGALGDLLQAENPGTPLPIGNITEERVSTPNGKLIVHRTDFSGSVVSDGLRRLAEQYRPPEKRDE